MIVPMRKLSLLIFYKEYQTFLEELRDRGVVHIHENKKRSAEDETLQAKLSLVKRVNEMIRQFENRAQKTEVDAVDVSDDQLLQYLEEQFHRKEKIVAQLGILDKELKQYEPWGDFSWERVRNLTNAGWEMRFFTAPDRNYIPEWEDKFNATVISEQRGQKYFVTLTPVSEKEKPEADAFTFPQETRESLLGSLKQLEEEQAALNTWLDNVALNAIRRLKIYRDKISETTDYLQVEDASQELIKEKVVALEGWVPINQEAGMIDFLQSRGVYYELTTPTPDEDVPVLLKNNRFTRLFEPITEMFALPNYHELDPTPFFAPFFMLFFRLCMGDGGYGLLIWLVCFFLARKASPAMKGYLVLGQYLGFATVVVGLLTGSFFGIALDAVEWPWLKGVKDYFVTEANYGRYLGGYNPMMVLAVAIGIFQILFGMCLSAAKMTKQFGFHYAMSTVAWVIALILLGVTFGLPALGVALPLVLTYVFYAIIGICAFVILFMNSPGKGIFMNLGSAIWGTYNMATGLLGDTLSYIRLFALGLTGSILGGVFNTLAFDLTATLPVAARFIAVFLILLVGHSINFGLCLIGAFVHPMRLTFVEFYKNASFEGGGKKYTPFRRRVIIEKQK